MYLDKDEEELTKMGITYVQGKKGPNDRIYFWNGKPISMREFGTLYAELRKNEDVNYPNGKGGKYLDEFLNDVKESGKVTEMIRKKYRIR